MARAMVAPGWICLPRFLRNAVRRASADSFSARNFISAGGCDIG